MAEQQPNSGPEPAPKTPKLNFLIDIVNNPRVQRISGYVLAIILFLYLFIAMLSFLGVVPRSISRNLPFIASVVNRADELDDLRNSKTMDAYHLNTKIVYPKFSLAYRKDDPYAENDVSQNAKTSPPDQVVMKRQFLNGRNVGEIYLNDQLVIRIGNKMDYVNEFARADAMADQLKAILAKKSDMLKLAPKMVSGNMTLAIDNTIVGQVYPQDAMLNNSTVLQQALSWVNNIRLALGINKALVLDDFVALEQPVTPTVVEAPVVTPQAEPTPPVAQSSPITIPDDKAKQKLMKKLVNVYNTMPSGQALDIFSRMTDEQAVEILAQMKDRQLSKILAIMDPQRAAKMTAMIADKKTDNKK